MQRHLREKGFPQAETFRDLFKEEQQIEIIAIFFNCFRLFYYNNWQKLENLTLSEALEKFSPEWGSDIDDSTASLLNKCWREIKTNNREQRDGSESDESFRQQKSRNERLQTKEAKNIADINRGSTQRI